MTDAWVAIPTEEEVRAGGRYKSRYDFGFIAGMARLLAAHEDIAHRFGALFAQIMFEPGHLTRREREMVAAVAAAAQDCVY